MHGPVPVLFARKHRDGDHARLDQLQKRPGVLLAVVFMVRPHFFEHLRLGTAGLFVEQPTGPGVGNPLAIEGPDLVWDFTEHRQLPLSEFFGKSVSLPGTTVSV